MKLMVARGAAEMAGRSIGHMVVEAGHEDERMEHQGGQEVWRLLLHVGNGGLLWKCIAG
jgi:hypothetical protein